MGANDIQQSLLDAMSLLSSKAANSTNAAITIKGEIIEELDSSTHQYKVSYGGAIYKDVYGYPNTAYASSTIVWILIPDGNFDNPKIILGAVTPSAIQYVTEEETDMYIPISSNLFGSESSIKLRSWEDETKSVTLTDINNFKLQFNDYLNKYRNFLFTAYIKTEIDKDHQSKGNYGLILNLPFKQIGEEGSTSKVWKSYVMDVSTIQGNPYAFNEYQKVELYYSVDDTLTFDTSENPSILAFTQDFGYISKPEGITSDIHIKNIAVKMVDVLSEAETNGYYLAVVASEGNYFLSGSYARAKTLTPILKVNGKDSNISQWECYWFVEDTSINIYSEDYTKLGGLGWKCLNEKTNVTYNAEGNKYFQYVTNNYEYTVQVDDVMSALRYKCVLTKDEIVVGGSVQLKNLGNGIETSLVSATGSNSFVENIGNVTIIARICYPGVTNADKPTTNISVAWQRFDQNGNYLDDILSINGAKINRYNDRVTVYGKECYETEITYPCSALEKLNTINCTFYGTTTKNGVVVNNNLGTETIIVTTTADLIYTILLDSGDVLYKYDADGDSPMIANYDGPASSKVVTINPITYKVFKPEGTELDDLEYKYAKYTWSFPKNSMMKLVGNYQSEDDNYYYISGWGQSSINYDILESYNKKKSNNTILISVDFDGNHFSDSVSPKFLKDGEGGTNGSKYAAILTYDNYAYGERDGNGKIRKFQAVYIADSGWKRYNVVSNKLEDFGSPILNVKVYKDGVQIQQADNYTVSWTMFDSFTTDPCFRVSNGAISTYIDWHWDDASKVYCSIVECAVTIIEDSYTNSQEVIYAYYPIEITRLQSEWSSEEKGIPTIDGGFEEVVFASDGTNPQYDNTNPFICTDNLYNENTGDLYKYEWSCSEENLKKTINTSLKPNVVDIKPVTKMDNGIRKNYVRAVLTMSDEQISTINSKIEDLGLESTKANNLKSFYEHDRDHILDFAQKFSYNECVDNYLNKAETLLQYRFEILNLIPIMESTLSQMYDYCDENNIDNEVFPFRTYFTNYSNNLKTVYEEIYLLGVSKALNNLYDYLYNKDITWNDTLKKTLTDKYGASITQQIQAFAETWNSDRKNKYEDYYEKLTHHNSANVYDLQEEYNKLYALDHLIIGFPQDADLDYLTNQHDTFDPTQEFVNLKEQLTALVSLLSNTSGLIISYYSFLYNIINEIQNLLVIYQDVDYQDRYYDELIKKYRGIYNDCQKQIESYRASLLPNSAYQIVHIKPIVMIYNRYEFSHINGWDGSKLYIDDKNKQYILAPQMGAGAKKDGVFTGVLMGVKQFNAYSTATQQIGLFGYSEGAQSLFINAEDGSAIFGKSGGGQIVIDPEGKSNFGQGLLYNSTYWRVYDKDGKPSSYDDGNKNYDGMLINLTESYIHLGNSVKGKIYSGTHDKLKSIDDGFYLGHNGISIGDGFSVAATGVAEIIGEGSNIGQWRVKKVTVTLEDGSTKQDQCLVSENNSGIFMDSPSSTIVLGSNSGRIYSGKHYDLNQIADGFYLSNKGLSIGSNFTVEAGGTSTITHDGSNIGQWQIITEDDGVQKLASNNNGIRLDAPNSRIILGGSNGEIYSGLHTDLGSNKPGFYLSGDGLSIGDQFVVYAVQDEEHTLGEAYINQVGSTIGNWDIITKDVIDEITYDEAGNEYITWKKDVLGLTSRSNNGFFFDSEHSTIVLGSSEGKIYSGKHYKVDETNNGFYLSNDGFSIGKWFRLYTDGNAQINHQGSQIGSWQLSGDSDGQEAKRLISQDGGITLDAASSIIWLQSNSGKIFSGTHNILGSTDAGFYLSNDGLSIGKYFKIATDGNATMNHQGSQVGSWQLSVDSQQPGEEEKVANRLLSNNEGIILDAKNSTIQLGSKYGQVYSGTHTILNSGATGFYLSNQGLSIGSKVYIDSDGILNLGRGAVPTEYNQQTGQYEHPQNARYWTIDDGSSGQNYQSYIGYNTSLLNFDYNANPPITGNDNEVYIGTNGIRLGSKFAVDSNGQLSMQAAKIGDWKIENGKLVGENGVNGRIELNARGSISGGDNDNNWSIDRDGDAVFNNIACNNIFSFGAGDNTWTRTSEGNNFNFGLGSLGGNTVDGSLSFTNGLLSLIGTPAVDESGHVTRGLVATADGVSIGGNIYAENGYFYGTVHAIAGDIGGCTIRDGSLEVPAAKITGTLTADHIDVSTIASSFTSSMNASFGTLSCVNTLSMSGDGPTAVLTRSKLWDLINDEYVTSGQYTGDFTGRTSSGTPVAGTFTIDL